MGVWLKMAQRLPVILNDDERKAILKQANKRYITGHRNKVMMQIMFNLGLRLAEVINLKWDDIDFLSEVLMIREGKGMKDRTLYVKDNNWRGEDDKKALHEWKDRQVKELGYLPDYVFTSMSKNAEGKKLQPRYIQDMVSRYAKRAEIKKNVSPHTLRHSFATDLYRKIKDPVTVKNALGHSYITTTMIYVHLVGADVEKALSGGD
jgi:integrase/recombinase XerD